MLDLTLSKEQQEILAKFLDDKDRDAIIHQWLKEWGLGPLQTRVITRILLPILVKYLGQGGLEVLQWMDDKLKQRFSAYHALSEKLAQAVLFKITRAKTLESLIVLRNTVSQHVDPEQWKVLDQQTKLWIQQFNRLDLISCSLGELKAPIRLQIDQPKLDSCQPSSRWLRAYNDFVPLLGRAHELQQLQFWCNFDAKFSWQVMIGEGGIGKTRLAREFAKVCRDTPWDSGFLDHAALDQLVQHDQFANWALMVDTLIIIDYAATKLESLKKLIQQCVRITRDETIQPAAKLRILLLERHAEREQGWMKEILTTGEGALTDDIQDAWQPAMKLLPPQHHDTEQTMQEILQATLTSWEKLQKKSAPQLPHFSTADYQQLWRNTSGRPLYLQMAALHNCEIGSANQFLTWRSAMLLQQAVERERGYLRKLCKAAGVPMTLLERMVALLVFSGKISLQHPYLFNIIRQEAENCGYPQTEPAKTVNVLDQFLADANRADGMLNPIQPDLIGSMFAVTILRQGAGLQKTLQHAIVLGGETAWANLLRSTQDLYPIDDLALADWLIPLLNHQSRNELWQIAGMLPQYSVSLRSFSVRVYQALLSQSVAEDLPEQALIFNNLGSLYGELGRHEEALEAVQRAVEMRECLNAKNPGVFERDLGGSLNNLGIRYDKLGFLEKALEATQHSVEIYERLSEKKPNAFEAYLAIILNSLGNRYRKLGYRKKALQAGQRSLEILERLSAKNPDAFESDMAKSLNSLGGFYSELGHCKEALKVARRAVEIYERLNAKNPDAFEPDLASSLNNLGLFYSELKLHQEALGAAQRAVEICERLSERISDRLEPDLAMSLGTLGSIFRDNDDALAAATFAHGIQVLSRLFFRVPMAFDHLMVKLCKAYFSCCAHAGQDPDEELLIPIMEKLEALSSESSAADSN
ncbi:tetratricopeptide repeat protein [Nitrosomonas ureae]|uniref:tetratricopeptide repeat protein n=1 Tax=Nitrosomonas ureae TaxID=44577 RepID=UPI000D754D92|nr:tetratricopeptide repeat protein [Nitrosomonas ureae]PXX16765.1 tetratricopeptide repeat protein [Nitrosomonas ureae]